MRILHVMASNGHGGAEVYSTDVMLSLHAQGIDQCVVMRETAPRTQELRQAGIRTATQVMHPAWRPLQKYKMRQLIEAEKPDIIHCWMRRAASLVPLQSHFKSKVIGWYGDYEEYRHFSHCSHFVGVTKDLVAHMIKEGIPAERAAYIPTFPSIDSSAALARSSLDTPEKAVVLLTLSRLHPTKGLDTLLQAQSRLPNCYLWIAGDGPMQAELETLAATLKIKDRVRFLGWRTDRGALLRAADICVLPSNYEPFGTVLLEAWCTRTPLVACNAAGPGAHIRNEENGMLVEANDPQALAKAIDKVINSNGLKENLIKEGYEEYERYFTKEAVTNQWLAYYQNLLKAGNNRNAEGIQRNLL